MRRLFYILVFPFLCVLSSHAETASGIRSHTVSHNANVDTAKSRLSQLFAAANSHSWRELYAMRTREFRDVLEYKDYENAHLKSKDVFYTYKVLDTRTYHFGANDIRCRFIISVTHGRVTSYDVVWWRYQNGDWYAENLGIPDLPFSIALVGETIN